MNFWTILWAVFIALYAMEEIKRYRQARERHKIYCQKEAIKYGWMTKMMQDAGRDDAAKQYAEQGRWWVNRSKDWIPTSPTQGEQEADMEQSQDDAIREAREDFETRHADATTRRLLKGVKEDWDFLWSNVPESGKDELRRAVEDDALRRRAHDLNLWHELWYAAPEESKQQLRDRWKAEKITPRVIE